MVILAPFLMPPGFGLIGMVTAPTASAERLRGLGFFIATAQRGDIARLNGESLIVRCSNLERSEQKLDPMIKQEVERLCEALDEQYSLIFKSV